MEKNADQFEDTDENKLVYTNIYQDYVHLLNQLMESQLKGTFSDEELEKFYLGFKDKMPIYEKIHIDVVDNLFAFIDFDKFKKQMLLAKNTVNENFSTAEDIKVTGDAEEQDDALFHKLFAEDVEDPSLGWRKTLQ